MMLWDCLLAVGFRNQPSTIDKRKSNLCFFGLIPLVVMMFGCGGRGMPEPIIVGHLASFSGPDKMIGQSAQQGILLAVEEAKDNLVHNHRVAVLHADTRSRTENFEAEAIRLIRANRVFALLGGSSQSEVESLTRTVQGYGVPTVALGELSGSAELSPSARQPVFSIQMSLDYRGRKLARFAARFADKQSGGGPILLLRDDRSEAGRILGRAVVRELEARSVTVEVKTYSNRSEFVELASRVRDIKPPVILVAGHAVDLAKLRTELVAVGVDAPLVFGADEYETAKLLAGRDTRSEVYVATVFHVDADTRRARDFVKVYKEKYQQEPDVHAALAFDGACLLFEAMRQAPTLSMSDVRDRLANTTDFESLTGPLSMGEDYSARRKLFVAQTKGNRIRLIESYSPSEDEPTPAAR